MDVEDLLDRDDVSAEDYLESNQREVASEDLASFGRARVNESIAEVFERFNLSPEFVGVDSALGGIDVSFNTSGSLDNKQDLKEMLRQTKFGRDAKKIQVTEMNDLGRIAFTFVF